MPIYDYNGWQIMPSDWITYATTTTNTPFNYSWRWNEIGSTTLSNYYGGAASSNTTSTPGTYWPPWVGERGTSVLAPATPQEIEAAAAEVERVAEEMALARDRRASERTVAIERGEALLLSLLDDNQRESYRFDGEFAVIGSCGTVYRIKRGTSGNIEWIKPDGSVGGRLCAHPNMIEQWLPTPDVMAAQALALMTDEAAFVAVANVHAGQRPPLGVS